MKNELKILGLLLLATMLFSVAVAPLSATEVKNPTTLVVDATEDEPEKLEPATDYESFGGWILQNTYETTTFYDTESPGHYANVLAESVTVSGDGKTIDFKFLANVYSVSYEPGAAGADSAGFKKWGPITAEDVKYSWDRTVIIGDPDGPAWMYEFVAGAADYMWGDLYGTQEGVNAYLAANGIEVTGPLTVRLHLTEAVWPAYQSYVMMQPWYAIMAEDCAESHGALTPGQESEWLMTHTCGTGPYTVTEWTPEDRIVMKKNPYWRNANTIQLDTILVEFIPDVSVRLDRFKLGDSDFGNIPNTHITEIVNPYAVPPVATWPGLVVYPSPTLTVMHIGLNMNPVKRPTTPFDDPQVRFAFEYLVDKPGVIASILKGLAIPANGPIVQGLACYNEAQPDTLYAYNKAKAKQVLLDAGYNAANPIRAVFGYNSGNLVRATVGIYLKSAAEADDMFDNDGNPFIFVDILGEPWPTYLQHQRTGTFYDMNMVGWIADFPDPDNFVFPYLHSKGTFASRIGFADAQIDAWIEEAKLTPRPAACSIYKQIQERAAQLAPHIYIYQPTALFTQRDWLTGFYPYSTNPMQYGYGFVWKMGKAVTTTTTTLPATTTTTTPPVPVFATAAVVAMAVTSVIASVIARKRR